MAPFVRMKQTLVQKAALSIAYCRFLFQYQHIIMKKTLFTSFSFMLLFSLVSGTVHAQKEDKAIKAVINRFFEAMQTGDTTGLLSTCTQEPVFQTFMKDKEGNMQIFTEKFEDFVTFVGNPGKDKFKEEIEFEAINAEISLASVWTPYKFYVNGKLSHCGTNSFQLVKTNDGWKIQYIIDTRRRGCK